MRISSHEVEAVKFAVTVRGYAEDEVDAFLDLVSATIGEYEELDVKARSEIERLKSALDECREACLGERRAAGAVAAELDELEARVRTMLAEATSTSERIIEQVLEAGQQFLDQISTSLPDPSEHGHPEPDDG